MAADKQDKLTQVLGETPPKQFNRISAKQRNQLADLIQDALDRQEAAVDAAEEDVLKFLPRPLRGSVRKLLLGGR